MYVFFILLFYSNIFYPSLHNNFPKLVMLFVSLYLQIGKQRHNQLIQTKLVFPDKMFYLKSKQYEFELEYALEYSSNADQEQIWLTASWNKLKKSSTMQLQWRLYRP